MDSIEQKRYRRVTKQPPISDMQQAFKNTYSNDAGALPKSLNKPPSSQHIKLSVRLPRGIVTSLTLKNNIIALWLLYRTPTKSDPEQVIDLLEEGLAIKEDTIKEMVSSFVYKSLDKWEHDTGKGLSDYVTELMIEDALENEDSNDYTIYESLMGLIK